MLAILVYALGLDAELILEELETSSPEPIENITSNESDPKSDPGKKINW